MSPATRKDASADRLNDLYWNSASTVSDIMRESGATRGKLYDAVRPLEADGVCPHCGGALVFRNRRSRSVGTASCTACGREVMRDGAVGEGAANVDAESRSGEDPSPSTRKGRRGAPDKKTALLGGAAAIGLVVGAAAARVIKD